jgi:hypothetical protein
MSIQNLKAMENQNQTASDCESKECKPSCNKCVEKDNLIVHLNKCIEEQKGSIEMLHKLLEKPTA